VGFGFQITDFQLIEYLLLQRELDFEAGEPQEVAIVGAKRSAVLDGKGGKVRVHNEGATGAGPWKQAN
jgi:hypothetical protein